MHNHLRLNKKKSTHASFGLQKKSGLNYFSPQKNKLLCIPGCAKNFTNYVYIHMMYTDLDKKNNNNARITDIIFLA